MMGRGGKGREGSVMVGEGKKGVGRECNGVGEKGA